MRRGRGRSLRRRAGLSVIDQAVTSLGNIALTLLVAHTLPLAAFGAYALLLAAYQVLVTMGQAVIGEPLMVLSGRTGDRELRGALGLSVLLGCVALLAVGIAGAVVDVSPPLLALALLMPGLLLQDGLRFVAFASGRPHLALLSDTVWVIGQFGATLVVLSGPHATVAKLILAWGAPSLAAAAVSLVSLKVRPGVAGVRDWVRRTKHLSRQYVGEAVANLAAFQAVLYVTGALAGLSAAGQLRIVQVLFGPVHVGVIGARAFGTPEISRRVGSGASYSRVVAGCTVALGSFSLLWTAAIAALPDVWAQTVLGAGWLTTTGLVWLLGGQKTLECLGTAPLLVHRAKERARWTFRTRAVATGVTVAVAAALAGRQGASGAALGMLLGSAVAVGAWWARYIAQDREVRRSHLPRVGFDRQGAAA